MNRLIFRYQYDRSFFDPEKDSDDFGRLSVTAATDRFSGQGGFWVQWQDVIEFAEALGTFPITADNPIVAQWGFDMQEGDDLILRFEISPDDTHGHLEARFEVADDYQPRHRVRGAFRVDYVGLEAFRHAVFRLMEGETEEATLLGH